MNKRSESTAPSPRSHGRSWSLIWRVVFAVWLMVIVFVPDPRPLSAPMWVVSLVHSLSGIGEPAARVLATLALRASGLWLLGALAMLALGSGRWSRRNALLIVVVAPLLGLGAMWANLGYFPIVGQLQISLVSTAFGALVGLALNRNLFAAIGCVAAAAVLFTWGTATEIDDELDAAARATGRHLLSLADEVPKGDAGFTRLVELAFAFAENNSHGRDPVLPNQAAILALGVILGDQRIADVAKRHIDPSVAPVAEALRARVTAYGRNDWPRHFWVSAALTLLSDADRSIAIGITKELMDATPGGSGFSFSDLAADAAGNRFTLAATRNEAAARAMQKRILGDTKITDFLPDIRDLPEGIPIDDFTEVYGGIRGTETTRIVNEIFRRLADCPGLS